MAARFGTRVALDWQVGAELLALRLPAISVQPLLENVFKHTVEQRQGRTGIAVSARCEGRELVLRVEDDAGVLAPPGTWPGEAGLAAPGMERGATGPAAPAPAPPGVGLANLRARLASLHGADGTLTLSQLLPAGVRAEMRVPCAP